ncbi:hypothetical protein KY289_029872 [Solanum tuberosum]|nr:hypothetical protein KY289_029872 [Solanum tuberosum]
MTIIPKNNFILIIGLVATLFSLALATPGTATFYTKYVPSACYGNKAQGTRIAAASDSLWGGGKICGKTFNVTCTGPTNPVPHPCTGKSIVVKIVDHCPGCGGTLDLSKEAFSTIANPVAGFDEDIKKCLECFFKEYGAWKSTSACYGSTPQGTIIAAASDPLWADGKICGKTFNVTCTGPTNPVPHPCTGKSMVVKIVDHCPGCGGTLDLSKEVFSTIANPVAGVIKIDYVQ